MQQTIYRAASAFALIIIFFAVVNFVYRTGEGDPMVPVAALLVAAAVWLLGWFCRFAFAKRMVD